MALDNGPWPSVLGPPGMAHRVATDAGGTVRVKRRLRRHRRSFKSSCCNAWSRSALPSA